MKKYSIETIVGLFVVIGLICVAYMTVKLGKVGFFGNNYYSIYANFTTVSGLRTGNLVEIDGIEVGQVGNMSLNQDKQMAIVELKIRKGIKIYDDAIASIKTAGLIGDKFIKIEPGGSGAVLKPGGRIIDSNSPIDIEDLIGKYVFGDVNKDGKKEIK
jgi:phospholipid/cholesterol/gamma-HCH transport system substrate-binding protein